jgi:hypothetical protein
MKGKLLSLLLISAVLNVLLLIGSWFRFHRPLQLAATSIPTAPVAAASARQSQVTKTNTIVVTNAPVVLDWRAVESEDYKKYIANLREIGCPERTIRDILVADVNELYRQRFLMAFPATNRVEYWKPGDALANVIDEEQIARLQEFGKEKRELITALLGSDYSSDIELTSIQTDIFMERLLDFLTAEKRTAMKELEHRYLAKSMTTYKDSVRGDNQSSKDLLAAKDEDVLKILTPTEKFEYDLRRSNDSMCLRVALGDFEVTEQEFRAVFPAMKKFVAEAGVPSLMAIVRGSGDPREQTLPARGQLESALKAALGENRFSELIAGAGWNLKGE